MTGDSNVSPIALQNQRHSPHLGKGHASMYVVTLCVVTQCDVTLCVVTLCDDTK